MRVCFDSLCFSSTQHRLADEEDAFQLQSNGTAIVVSSSSTSPSNSPTAVPVPGPNFTAITATTCSEGLGQVLARAATPPSNSTLTPAMEKLQELLRTKDERISQLEATLTKKDNEIQDLRSHLDKFISIMSIKSPLTPTKSRPRKQRAQGISAEPPLHQLTPLKFYDKSDRLVLLLILYKRKFKIAVEKSGRIVHCSFPFPSPFSFFSDLNNNPGESLG
ncbi:GSCOCG00010419001-RA-CDS, partial [Cotesia congregata]